MESGLGKKIIESLSEFSEALKSGDTKKLTCRKVTLDLKPIPYSPERVREARSVLGVSQGVFAEFLGVSRSTIIQWENGKKSPQDIACRFMDEILLKPKFWQKRLRESIRVKAR